MAAKCAARSVNRVAIGGLADDASGEVMRGEVVEVDEVEDALFSPGWTMISWSLSREFDDFRMF